MLIRSLLLVLLVFTLASTLSSCGGGGRSQIFTPGIDKRTVEWTAEEQKQIFSFKKLHSAAGTSTHAMRLAGRSDSRVHDHHDMTVVLLSGRADIRLAGKWHTVNAGDIVEIPRGSIYEFDQLGSEPVECYVMYYPPYDGKDLRYIKGK
jgi:mannose-6-phosphate isomerase-like protein (cupin superfamily)